MSNLDPDPDALDLSAAPGAHHAVDVLQAREAAIGDRTEVRRLPPQRVLQTIGAWCFIDHFGPEECQPGAGWTSRRTRTSARGPPPGWARPADGNVTLATRPGFEYGVLAADAPATVTMRNGESSGAFGNSGVRGAGATARAGGTQFRPGMLARVPAGSEEIELSAPESCGFMIVDGSPLAERLVM